MDARRSALASAAAACPRAQALERYLSTPLPGEDVDIRELPLLAVDMETSGLDPMVDQLFSIGFVAVNGLEIDLSTARHILVRPADPTGVGQSAAVHGLTDDALERGVSLHEAISELLLALAGRIMLVHFSAIETGFIDRTCRKLYSVPAPTHVVDTLELQARVLSGNGEQALPPGALRLAAARHQLGLPTYAAHEALTDALACAELYLAQVTHLAGQSPMPLRRLR